MSIGMAPNLAGGLQACPSSGCHLGTGNSNPQVSASPSCNSNGGNNGNGDTCSANGGGEGGAGSVFDSVPLIRSSLATNPSNAWPVYVYHDVLCSPPPGQSPPPVPGPGAAYSQQVVVRCSDVVHDVSITCVDTGVTQNAVCAPNYPTFYHDTTGTKTYTTPGGPTSLCNVGMNVTAGPGSASAAIPTTPVTILVSCSV